MARQATPLELIGPPDVDGGARTILRFELLDWAAFAPGIAGREAWMAWATAEASLPQDDTSPVPVEAIPAALRRRLDRMGRLALQALFTVGAGAEDMLIFASRFGELGRSIDLMRQIANGELPSPTGFTLSVHNALAGQASIVLKNKVAHSAVAAGTDTLAMALVEAALAAAEQPGRDIVLVCYDLPPPALFDARADEGQQVAVALRLSAFRGQAGSAEATVANDTDPMPYRALLRLIADEGCASVAWQGRHGAWGLRRAA